MLIDFREEARNIQKQIRHLFPPINPNLSYFKRNWNSSVMNKWKR